MPDVDVRVETVQLDQSGNRQIGEKHRTTEQLKDRRSDVEAAVREASMILQHSAAKVEEAPGWRVSSLEARFGITLTAEAGVVVSRVSAEASFEITISVERA